MERRGFLGLLSAAVAVAAFPLPFGADVSKLSPEFYRERDKAFVVIDAPDTVRTGDFVLLAKTPIGVAIHDAPRGNRLVVQVYGVSSVKVYA